MTSSPVVGRPMPPSGPAAGVVQMPSSPKATAQHAHGALPIWSITAQRRGAVPVRSATTTVASTMPAAKQATYVGIQIGWMKTLSLPGRTWEIQPMLIPRPPIPRSATVSVGRHRRPRTAIAANGSAT